MRRIRAAVGFKQTTVGNEAEELAQGSGIGDTKVPVDKASRVSGSGCPDQ
jgi:hypothetical protein